MNPAQLRAQRATRQEVGTWWNPATPDDVRNEQNRVQAARSALSLAIIAKPPAIPPADPAEVANVTGQWGALSMEIGTYVAEDPSALWWTRDDQVKRGTTYETKIEAFRQQFERLGAGVPPAPVQPVQPAQPGLLSNLGLGDVSELIKWAVIGFVAFELLGNRGKGP